jgi:hypothetical protein
MRWGRAERRWIGKAHEEGFERGQPHVGLFRIVLMQRHDIYGHTMWRVWIWEARTS